MNENQLKLWRLVADYARESEWLGFQAGYNRPCGNYTSGNDPEFKTQVEKRDIAEAAVYKHIEELEI